MVWMLCLTLFLLAAGIGLAFYVYLCLLWYASIRRPDDEKAASGLTASELLGLPGAGDGGMVKGTECTVCLDDIEDGQPARVLPACHHAFHRRCIDEWLSTQPACPNCRAGLLPFTPQA